IPDFSLEFDFTKLSISFNLDSHNLSISILVHFRRSIGFFWRLAGNPESSSKPSTASLKILADPIATSGSSGAVSFQI
ncbi:MAG: hypothetical protein EBU49_06200, partial [Proteobacteria bacterium]|nr:hypothetical protein [Pseudomonadota bacterium]